MFYFIYMYVIFGTGKECPLSCGALLGHLGKSVVQYSNKLYWFCALKFVCYCMFFWTCMLTGDAYVPFLWMWVLLLAVLTVITKTKVADIVVTLLILYKVCGGSILAFYRWKWCIFYYYESNIIKYHALHLKNRDGAFGHHTVMTS